MLAVSYQMCYNIIENKNEMIIMARTASVYAMIDPETKEQAEFVLNQLGIPMSNAIGMFLKQVVLQYGIPFDIKLPTSKPVAIGSMTKEQIDIELQKGVDDIDVCRVVSADIVEEEMKKMYGV